MKEARNITSKEYCDEYIPGPGFCLIQRDGSAEVVGSLLVPKCVRDRKARMSGTGVILAVSPIPPETPYDKKLWLTYKEGDRVGFDATVPYNAPAPPHYNFFNPDREDDNSVIIHCADIVGILCEDPEKKEEFNTRAEEIWK